jgi:ABC-type dipeptide/oligopeptide/nickel transport system ATPase component
VHQVFQRPAHPYTRDLLAVVRELEDDPVDAGGRP